MKQKLLILLCTILFSVPVFGQELSNLNMKALWSLSSGTGDETASITPNAASVYIKKTYMTVGEDLSESPSVAETYDGYTQTLFTPIKQSIFISDDNAIKFMFDIAKGYSFTPTKVGFKAARWRTDKCEIYVGLTGNGEEKVLANGVTPNRNYNPESGTGDKKGCSIYNYYVSGLVIEGSCGLCINVSELPEGRSVSIGDVYIEGLLNSIDYSAGCTLQVKVNPVDGGTVRITPDATIFKLDEEVTLTQTPNKGYLFTGWSESGEILSTEPTLKLVMDGDRIITSNYTTGFTVDRITYNLISAEERTVWIKEVAKNLGGNIVIPSEVVFGGKKYAVVLIGAQAFSNCKSLESITIPNSVTSIGTKAFDSCNRLKSIVIGSNVTSIGERALYSCDSLRKITLLPNTPPSGVSEMFDRSSTYKGITYVANDSYNDIEGIGTIKKYDFLSSYFDVDGVRYVPVSPAERTCAAIDCTYNPEINNITIDKTVTYDGVSLKVIELNTYTLYANDAIKTINISTECSIGDKFAQVAKNVEIVKLDNKGAVGSFAFADCIGLKDISVGANVTDILDCAFRESMTTTDGGEITLNNSGVIGVSAFESCGGLKTLSVGANVTDVMENAFKESMTASDGGEIILNNSGVIGVSAFENCRGLKTLKVEANVTDIMENAFKNSMTGVSEGVITLKNTGSIGESAFDGCTGLCNASLEETITSMGVRCFNNCKSLISINIPSSVNRIPELAFSGCSSLAEIKLHEKIEYIGVNAFNSSGLKSITIPAATTEIRDGAFYKCSALAEFITIDGVKNLKMGYSGVADRNMFANSPLKEVFIGRNLVYPTDKEHGFSPFYGNESLEKVTLTDMPTEVFTNEFYGCIGLKEVSIGDGVTKIGNYAFSRCSAIKSFSFGFNVKTIGDEAFSDCTAMTELYAEPATPPTCGTQALDDIHKFNCTLYVPEYAMDKYKTANQWKEFFKIKGHDFPLPQVTDIVISEKELAIYVDDTYQLEATPMPEYASSRTVIWTSSNPSVATVSESGLVTAVSVGTATITAICDDVSATCAVTVTTRPVLATAVTLSQKTLSLYVDDSETLTATVSPEDVTDPTIVWTSSNPSVATVSEAGLVTAVSTGTATITATCGEVSATCAVTVITRPVLATAVTLNKTTLSLYTGDSEKLIATVTPADATNNIVWNSSNPKVASVTGTGNVVALSEGTAIITASCGDVSASCTVNVILKIVPVEEITLDQSMMFLTKGDSGQLEAILTPVNTTDAVTWKSSDPTVATVSKTGLVKAYAEGRTTITATCGNLNASCEVFVLSQGLYLSAYISGVEGSGTESEPAIMESDNRTIDVILVAAGTTFRESVIFVIADANLSVLKQFDPIRVDVPRNGYQEFGVDLGAWGELNTTYCFALFADGLKAEQITNPYYFIITDSDGIIDVLTDDDEQFVPQDVYTLNGMCIKRNATEEDIKALTPGFYIIGGRKVLLR